MAEGQKDGGGQSPEGGKTDPLAGADDAARRAAANGEKATAADEEALLGFLLDGAEPIEYHSKVKIATPPKGRTLEVTWYFEQRDGRELDEIENRNMRNGPLGQSDDLRLNAEIVAAASRYIVTPSGRKIEIYSKEFLKEFADVADALLDRFRYQPGLLAGLASQVRAISGWAADRVGEAQATLVSAVGNSSDSRSD